MKSKFTPEYITELKPDEVFVFGSNLSGIHGAGAAKLALDKFGAVLGEGVGHFGQSYALPTKDCRIYNLPLDTIKKYIEQFVEYANTKPELSFYMTKIGTGLASIPINKIKELFIDLDIPDNVILPKEFEFRETVLINAVCRCCSYKEFGACCGNVNVECPEYLTLIDLL